MGERLGGHLNEAQTGMGCCLEDDEGSITPFRFRIGEMTEEGEKVIGGAYNPVPIAIVSKSADPNKERLIGKLLLLVQR